MAPVEKATCPDCGVELVEGEEHACETTTCADCNETYITAVGHECPVVKCPTCNAVIEGEDHVCEEHICDVCQAKYYGETHTCPKCDICEGAHETEKCEVVCEVCGLAKHEGECEMCECGKLLGHEDACQICLCGAIDENTHAEDCMNIMMPKCEICEGAHTTEKCPENFAALYDALMSCATHKEVMLITNELSEEEETAFLEWISDEDITALEEHLEKLYADTYENVEEEPAVNFDDVAPLIEAELVATASTPMRFALRAAVPTITEGTIDASADNGLEINKTAYKTQDGGYEIKLEAFTTGSVTKGEAKPSDIILVVDLSTSMTNKFSDGGYVYTEVYSLNKNQTYYAGNSKEAVEWCSRCNAWTDGCSWFIGHRAGDKVTPKTSASSSGTQFYTRTEVSSMTRLDALKQAASVFISQVADEETADRIAIVGFGQNAYYMTGGNAVAAFLDATSNATSLTNVITGIDGRSIRNGGDLEPATEHGKGLEYAVNIFSAQPANTYTNRNKVVVMLTDGEPAPSGTDNWSSRTVKQAINSAYTLKNTHSASVYCISVMPGTDASNISTDMDRYMDYVSSNYPNAQYTGNVIDNEETNGDSYYNSDRYDDGASTTETTAIMRNVTPGTKIDTTNGSYYLTAGDISTLESIFGQIGAQMGGATTSLGASTVVYDGLSQYFQLPENAGDNIT
ncbi:MAG: VWA domain-containing protein, partial [Clostridia bacterium]|nr:VWA domain-containing protein [Clostridia bacterium]